MSDRETKTFKTTAGTELVIKTYLTGGEARQIEGKYLSMAKIDIKGDEPVFKELDLNVRFEVEKALIEMAIESVNGSKENVLQTILDLRSEEYEEVISELNLLTPSKKKNQ